MLAILVKLLYTGIMNEKLKKFLEMSKSPLIVASIVALLYIVDGLLVQAMGVGVGKGFIWVAFAAWTISFGMTNKQRVKMWIGHFIGFGLAVAMVYFGQIFGTKLVGISIAGVIAVFLFNMLAMYFENLKKFWLDSVTGIFMGIFLTFSGLGISLNVETAGNAFTLLGIIMLYSLLGCICAFCSVWLINKWKKKPPEVIKEKPEDKGDEK